MKLSSILTKPLLALGSATLLIGIIKGNRIHYQPSRPALAGSCTNTAIADYYYAYAYQIGNPSLAIKYFHSARKQVEEQQKSSSIHKSQNCKLLTARLDELAKELFRVQTAQ